MTEGERYVVLGLAHARSPWFRDLARWSTAAALPCEFVKCVSVEEARARLASGRAFSALLLDGGLPGIDRDLVDRASASGCAVLVVDDGRVERDWTALGAHGVLDAGFSRDDLATALAVHATTIERREAVAADAHPPAPAGGWRAPLLAVTGPGGTGASTVAMALAQGLADDGRNAGMVLLADLALHADHAMLHDVRDVVPGVQELVEAHRGGLPSCDEVRSIAFDISDRRYHLLLGLRRHRDWTVLRPRAVAAAVDGLRRSYRWVVADVDADVEGEDDCGSSEVEERNVLARCCLRTADAVVVVGGHGAKGTHALARTVRGLLAFGVAPARLLPLVNRAPRSPRRRAEIARAIATLAAPTGVTLAAATPVFLPDRPALEDAVHHATRLPAVLASTVSGAVTAVTAVVERTSDDGGAVHSDDIVPVRPGSLGAWADGA